MEEGDIEGDIEAMRGSGRDGEGVGETEREWERRRGSEVSMR